MTQGNDKITIFVTNSVCEQMHFSVKNNTPMSKVFEAYASRVGLDVKSLRFLFEGETVLSHYTPRFLELENNDQIEVISQIVGD